MDAVLQMKRGDLPIKFHRRNTRRNVKELFRTRMVMSPFSGAGGYALLNDAQSFKPDKLPTIKAIAPDIILGRIGVDHRRAHSHSIVPGGFDVIS